MSPIMCVVRVTTLLCYMVGLILFLPAAKPSRSSKGELSFFLSSFFLSSVRFQKEVKTAKINMVA